MKFRLNVDDGEGRQLEMTVDWLDEESLFWYRLGVFVAESAGCLGLEAVKEINWGRELDDDADR